MAPQPLPHSTDSTVFTQAPSAPPPDLSGLSNIGHEVAQIGTKMAVSKAQEDGAEAVSRDPATGQPQFHSKTEIFPWDKAYNEAGQAAFQAQSDGDQRLKIQQFFLDNPDDPQAALTKANGWLKTYAGGTKDASLRPWILSNGGQLASQYMLGAVRQKQAVDVQKNLETLTTSYTAAENDFLALAYQHGAHTPEAEAAFNRMSAVAGQMKNPIFEKAPARVDAMLQESGSMGMAEAARAHTLGIAKTEGVDAGLKAVQDTFYDPALKLSMAQRDTYANKAQQDIREWHAGIQQDAEEAQRQLSYHLDDAKAAALATGDWQKVVTAKSITDAFPNDQAHAHAIIAELDSASRTHSFVNIVKTASPQQLAQMQADLDPTKGGSVTAPALTGTSVEGLIQTALPGSTITSRSRTPQQNAAVDGVTDSAHLHDRARDLEPPQGVSLEDAAAKIRAANPALKVIVEGPGAAHSTAPHIHVEWEAGATGDTGFANRMNEFKAFEAAVTDRQKALTADPAGFVLSTARPDIAKQGADALKANNMAGFQNSVRASLQVQRDFGVNAPRILSKTAATGIVQQFNNAPDPAKRAEHMTAVISSLQQQYGRYFQPVMGELRNAGMPAEAVALAQVQGDPVVQVRMSNAINAGRETLRNVVIDKANDIDKAIPDAMSDFTATLVGNQDASKIQSQQLLAAKLYAYQLASEGKGATEAAEQAVTDILAKHYDFADTYRVPKGVGASQVTAGASFLLNQVTPQTVSAESTADKSMPEAQRRDLAARVLRKRGVWATTPDETGLRLLFPAETGYVPARDAKGKWIQYTWDQLKSAGARASASDESTFSTFGGGQ